MSTDLDALIYRISHLESRINELDSVAVEPVQVTNETVTQTTAVRGVELIILDSPVVLSSGSGGSSWTTQSGTWPLNATHVYVSVDQGVGPGAFEVRKDSTATEYAICGALSAAVFSDRTSAAGFAALSGGSTFDWRNVANTAYSLKLVGYLVPVS
jgi:hypothetical protein